MISGLAKAFLALSSLAPVLVGYGILAACDEKPWWLYGGLFSVAGGLVLLGYCLPKLALERIAAKQLDLKSVKDADKEVLAFLITYLLPLVGKPTLGLETHYLLALYVFIVIFITILHTNAFTFNPLLAMLGYHFFDVETEEGTKYLLLTKKSLNGQKHVLHAVKLSPYVFLEGEPPDQ